MLTLPEWSRYEHLDAPAEEPVLEESREVERQIATLRDSNACDVLLLRKGFRVVTRSFVGRVRVGRLTLVIEPKLRKAPLAELLRYAFGFGDLRRYDDVAHSTARLAFQDLLAWILADEVAELLARGLTRRYSAVDEDLAVPRGRLDFNRLARSERASASLPCRHHLRRADNALNRALRMGLHLARQVATDRAVRARLHGLVAGFEGVMLPRIDRTVLDEARRRLDRTTTAYVPALNIVGLLLDGAGVALAGEPRVHLDGFLLDMNRFFQELVGRFFRDHLDDGAVVEERPLHGVLAWDPVRNPQKRQQRAPRPDYAVRRGPGEALEILDAKYQDLWKDPPSPEVVYQLALYATSAGVRQTATILYPGDRRNPDQALLVQSLTSAQRIAELLVRPVDLLLMRGLLGRSGTHRDRAAYARALAFGAKLA